MKKYLYPILVLLCAGTLSAQETIGVGVILGNVSGVNGTYVNSTGNFSEAMLGWGAGDNYLFQATYNFGIATLSANAPGVVELYAGPGLFLHSPQGEDLRFGIAGNLELGWQMERHLEFMVEASPKLALTRISNSEFTSGFGFRFVF